MMLSSEDQKDTIAGILESVRKSKEDIINASEKADSLKWQAMEKLHGSAKTKNNYAA